MPVASMALTPYSNYLAPEQVEVEESEKNVMSLTNQRVQFVKTLTSPQGLG